MPHLIKTCVLSVLCTFICTTLCAATESFAVTLTGNETELFLTDKIDDIEVIEFSDDLQAWTPVARNYDNQWESTYPFAYDLNTVNGSNDLIMMLPTGYSGYYRKRSAVSVDTASKKELAARFLMQASFGPTREAIDNFPGLNSDTFGQVGDDSFEEWIENQMDESIVKPFYHRAYWRERSDPAFTDQSSGKTYLDREVNEVGHNPAYGQQFPFNRGQTIHKTDWTNPLPGYGGLFDTYGGVIDENHPDWPTDPDDFDNNGRPMIGLHVDKAKAHIENSDVTNLNVWDITMTMQETKQLIWYKAAIDAPDQLRQRIAWALSQYFVIGEVGTNQTQAVERWLNYYDIFTRHAFGNFRDILDEVTWSPHMGYYLSHIENKKADTNKRTFPDENYAREVMQLFTIGLWKLNQNGTLKLENGEPAPTYDNDDIFEFAKVFTGMRRPLNREPTDPKIEELSNNYIDPMRVNAGWHDFSAKTLLDGSQLGPFNSNQNGVRKDVAGLLDHLFEHENMPPFFARFLIQRLTVSNPSPKYIYDVAEAFKTGIYEGSGSSQPGCMKATIKAILLHPEARSLNLAYDPNHGKLREPIIRLIHVARAFGLTSQRTYGWFNFKDLHDKILQAPYESPSVFNFYRPDYSPNGNIGDAGLTAPEFQIHNDVSSLHLANGLTTLINHGLAGGNYGNIGQRNYIEAVPDYSHEITLASNTTDLLNHLDLLLCAGRLTAANKEQLQSAITDAELTGIDKVKYLANLIVLCPEFNTLY